MSHAAITFLVLGAAVVLFVWNPIPPEITALGTALSLYAAGVIDSSQAVAGFGDPAVIFIASLFVVSESLDVTGVTTWFGQHLAERAGSQRQSVALTLLLAALLAAVITPNGSVAALLPMSVVMALRTQQSPSAVLMPLAFAASAGAMLALTGSPVNILVSEAAASAGGRGFRFAEFAFVGVPLVAGTIAITLLLGGRLIRERRAKSALADLGQHARTLADQYELSEEVLVRHDVPSKLFTRRYGVAEVVIPPRSQLIGTEVFPGMVTTSGDLVVLAVQRKDEDIETDTELAAGDTLLLQGTWKDLDHNLKDSEVLLVDRPERVRRQAVPLGPGAKRAATVALAMVILLASGAVPAFVASLLAACALVTLRVVSLEQAYRSISWTTVILIGAMFASSTAIKDSGAAEKIAHALVQTVGSAGPHALLAGLFVLTATLGQLISNTATALVVVPIALSAASSDGVSPRPVLMSVAVAAAASFLTPVATPANMMVMSPAGYRFADYWRFGLCVTCLFFVVAVLVVPLFWSF